MIQVQEVQIPAVTRRVVAPAVYRFPGLPTQGRITFGKWGWNNMNELDSAITLILQAQGYRKEHIHYIAEYDSFRAEYLPGLFPQVFAWVNHQPSRTYPTTTLHVNPNEAMCPFKSDSIYVPTGWAQKVIRLVNEGVTSLKLHGETPYGQRWDNVLLSRETLYRFLKN